MSSLFSWLFGRSPNGPPVIPTDDVVPMHPFDDTIALRNYTLIWTFKFDEVLDADFLGDSLSRLFEMEGWRKLGGRLRLRPDGKAEVHVPCPFTKERPSLHFTKEHHDIRMANHAEASQLPEASSQPTTFLGARHFSSLALGPGAPRTIQDYFQMDVPQFSLHVVTFTDGTLVSINFNHVTSDLGGLIAILKAWTCILAGKPEEVAPFIGYRDDPMVELYRPKEPTTIKLILAQTQLEVETWWTGLDGRMICIPKKAIDSIIQDARDHVALKADTDLFVSENDVVMAICNRLLASRLALNRSIVNLIVVDARSRVKSVFRDDAAYVQNTNSAAIFLCQANDALELPIGEIALRSRLAVDEQCTEEQLKSTAKHTYDSLVATGNPLVIGKDISSLFMVVSNWSKAGFLDKFDFSPAIVKPSATARPGAKPGHAVYFHSQPLSKGFFSMNMVTIMGRDLTGNFWLSGEFSAATWDSATEFFREYLVYARKKWSGRVPTSPFDPITEPTPWDICTPYSSWIRDALAVF
ncbi:hypothetical protein EDB81DRAFT_758338 [Dactylonectria macrodidyma]|uniref:Uncharacterized protein n=1 Tax=Dactylonectria macrodidyma TaxID=307937 RepID=A0A9P9JC55_9HYPO|nr:hypothetical protein EDB81DRAFT_758338 [Dactylonectria macrodidyma]